MLVGLNLETSQQLRKSTEAGSGSWNKTGILKLLNKTFSTDGEGSRKIKLKKIFYKAFQLNLKSIKLQLLYVAISLKLS